jgi:hypothetical protein
MRSDSPPPSEALGRLQLVVTSVIRGVYAMNVDRHDPLVGDDAHTFASHIWRNTWFQLEQELEPDGDWKVARPLGSFTITGNGIEAHVYKCGIDETADLERFRLDDPEASLTKQQIPASNQLALDLWDLEGRPAAADPADFSQLVVLHAGNPDDGCCGVWIGAPVPMNDITNSPWAWVRPLWTIDRAGATTEPTAGHANLAEPIIEVELISEPAEDARAAHTDLDEHAVEVEVRADRELGSSER